MGGNDDAMRVKVRLNQYWHSDSSERILISNIWIGAWKNATEKKTSTKAE